VAFTLSGGWRLGSVMLVVLAVLLSGDVVRGARASTAARADADADAVHGDGRAVLSSRQVNNAAWYVGTTSAGTQIDFRMSPSGGWVRDFHFGRPPLTRSGAAVGGRVPDGNFPLRGLQVSQGGDFGPSRSSVLRYGRGTYEVCQLAPPSWVR
jgi:hypothetical protein